MRSSGRKSERGSGGDLSVKARRLLERWRVMETLDGGAAFALVGARYACDEQRHGRLAFHRDDEQRLCVGYALERDGQWEIEDSEPFSLRALGYYERRLKRLARRHRDGEPAE